MQSLEDIVQILTSLRPRDAFEGSSRRLGGVALVRFLVENVFKKSAKRRSEWDQKGIEK